MTLSSMFDSAYWSLDALNEVTLSFQLKWTEVVQDCSQAVELNPRYIKALFRRAKALEKLDNKKECLEGKLVVAS